MSRKLATYLCCAIMAVFAMNLTVISPLLIEISKTFSLTIAQSGFIFTAEFAGFVTFILLGGILADHWGKKTVVSISLAGLTLSLLLFTLAPNFYIACLIMVLIGGFGGVIESVVTALVSDLNEVHNSFYVNLSQVFFGLGALVGPIIAGIMVSAGISWKLCYIALTGILLVLTIIFGWCKMPGQLKSEKIQVADLKTLFTNRQFMLVCLCMVFYTGSEVGGWGWLSIYLKQSMSFSIIKSGIAVAVFWAAMTIGRFCCGWLTLRYSLKSIIVVLAILSAAVTVPAVFVTNETILWVIIAMMGFAYSSQFPLIASFGSRYSNAPSGTVFAILIGSGGLGSMTVPYLMGVIGDNSSMRLAMLCPAILLLAVGLILLLGAKQQSKV